MFCKNCGNKLTEGQVFCTNCGAKQEALENATTPVENNSTPVLTSSQPVEVENVQPSPSMVTTTSPVENNSTASTNMSSTPSVAITNNENGNMNNVPNQMGVNQVQNTSMNNMMGPNPNANVNNVMAPNPNPNPTPNANPNMNGNNGMGTNNANAKKPNTAMIIAGVAVVVAIVAVVFCVKTVLSVNNKTQNNTNNKNNTGDTVATNSTKKTYKGYNFYIPKEFTVSVSETDGMILTKPGVTYSIAIDNSTYEENCQEILTLYPQLKGSLEVDIDNRRIAGATMKDGSAILFSKASATQTFFAVLMSNSGPVNKTHISEIVSIFNKAEKDASTFSEGTGSNDATSNKIEENKNNMVSSIEVE